MTDLIKEDQGSASQQPTTIEPREDANDQGGVAEPCGCIADMNDKLAEHNTVLTVPMLGQPRAILSTYQRETGRGKKRAAYVFANFCPFCGVKYGARP